jgi:hypothetical protein
MLTVAALKTSDLTYATFLNRLLWLKIETHLQYLDEAIHVEFQQKCERFHVVYGEVHVWSYVKLNIVSVNTSGNLDFLSIFNEYCPCRISVM